MKIQISLFVIVSLMVLSTFNGLKVNNRLRIKSKGEDGTCMYQFCLGFMATLGGASATKIIDECLKVLPATWQATSKTEETKNEMGTEMGGSTNTALQTVLKYLGVAIDTCCKFKENIINFFTKKYRRRMKLFMEGKIKMRGIWDWIANTASSVWNSFTSACEAKANAVIKELKDWAGKKVSDLLTWVQTQLKETFRPILDAIEGVKAKILAWIQHPLLVMFLKFSKCLYDNNVIKALKDLWAALGAFTQTVSSLVTPAGWVSFLVKCICNWKMFRDAINAFKEASSQTAATVRCNRYGDSLAKLMKAVSASG